MAINPSLSKHVYCRFADSHLTFPAITANYKRQSSLRNSRDLNLEPTCRVGRAGKVRAIASKQNRVTHGRWQRCISAGCERESAGAECSRGRSLAYTSGGEQPERKPKDILIQLQAVAAG